ncbi:MAG: site-2 protease family protein [Thermoprotei archaeon]|nr:MAG: site-2 protease family protein [Thermoprotei archaeon]
MELIVSWLVISFCFSVYGINYGMDIFLIIFAASLMTAGLGFILHELMHRFTARRFGCLAEYRMWLWGLILALIVALGSGGRFIFAAPGAVYITPLALTSYISVRHVKRAYGLISLAGPMANIMLAAIFYMLLNLRLDWFLYIAARIGFTVNLWLAAFNLIPAPPLDGFKVFRWSPIIWGIIAIPTWAILVLTQLL